MKKNMLKIKITNCLIILISILTVLLQGKPTLALNVNLLLWIFICSFFLIKYGFYRDKGYFKKIGINYTLICCLSYMIIIYLMGILLGFSYSIFNRSLVGLLKNIYQPLLLLFSQVYIRNVFCKNENRFNKSILIFTILCIVNNIILNGITYNFSNNESIFIFICLYMIPVIAKEFLYTYLCLNVSYIPCLIIGIILDILIYFLPIYPNLGNFLTAVTSIFLPFLIYIVGSKVVMYHEKKEYSFKKFTTRVTTIPFLVFAVIVIILVSGIFRYKMIAIASDSMKGTFSRGDAVIYDQKIEIDDLKVGDVIVFTSDNKNITHRITKKYFEDGKVHFVTKGDANNDSDEPIIADDVIGKIDSIVYYFGFPTLWFRDIFNKNR